MARTNDKVSFCPITQYHNVRGNCCQGNSYWCNTNLKKLQLEESALYSNKHVTFLQNSMTWKLHTLFSMCGFNQPLIEWRTEEHILIMLQSYLLPWGFNLPASTHYVFITYITITAQCFLLLGVAIFYWGSRLVPKKVGEGVTNFSHGLMGVTHEIPSLLHQILPFLLQMLSNFRGNTIILVQVIFLLVIAVLLLYMSPWSVCYKCETIIYRVGVTKSPIASLIFTKSHGTFTRVFCAKLQVHSDPFFGNPPPIEYDCPFTQLNQIFQLKLDCMN